MGTDASGQAVVHRGDVELALQNPEAPFDIGQRLAPVDDLGGLQIRGVGHQHQRAVEKLGTRLGAVVLIFWRSLIPALGMVGGCEKSTLSTA